MVRSRVGIAALAWRLGSLATMAALAGCVVPFSTYTVSSSNVSAHRASQRAVELGDFLGLQASASCRLRNLGPDGGRSFAQYIRGAFNDELVIAGVPAAREHSTLSLKVTDVSVECGNIWGSWTVEAEVRISNQLPFKVKVVREFDGNFVPDIVWQRANTAFVPAVQELIATIMANPAYKAEFGARVALPPLAQQPMPALAPVSAAVPASAAMPVSAAASQPAYEAAPVSRPAPVPATPVADDPPVVRI